MKQGLKVICLVLLSLSLSSSLLAQETEKKVNKSRREALNKELLEAAKSRDLSQVLAALKKFFLSLSLSSSWRVARPISSSSLAQETETKVSDEKQEALNKKLLEAARVGNLSQVKAALKKRG